MSKTKKSITDITGRVIKVREVNDLEEKTHTLITLFVNGSEKDQILFNFKIKEIYEGHKINIQYNNEKKWLIITDFDTDKKLYDGKYLKEGDYGKNK